MLSESQIQDFSTKGYLVLEGLVDNAHLDAVHTEYSYRMDELYQQWFDAGFVEQAPQGLSFWQKLDQCYGAKGFDWYQPFDISLPHADITETTPMHHGPAIFNVVTNNNILDVVESLIGGEVSSNPIQHIRIKPPEYAVPKDEIRAHIVATDWHQDRGVGSPEADNTDMITVWIAMTDATIENGCLQVIPGPHEKMLPHCPKVQTAIADDYLEKSKAKPVPVKAGGAVILHPLTPHSSLSNNTEAYRWSFDLRFNITGQATGRSQFPDFIARSRSNPDSELRDWQAWKKLWEESRINVANMPHIPQHRWQSDSPHCA